MAEMVKIAVEGVGPGRCFMTGKEVLCIRVVFNDKSFGSSPKPMSLTAFISALCAKLDIEPPPLPGSQQAPAAVPVGNGPVKVS